MAEPRNEELGKRLLEYLHEIREVGDTGSDDIVGLMLPLLEQVVATHSHDQVAPLNGIDALRVSLGHLWYANADATEPELNARAVRKLAEPISRRQVDVTREVRIDESESMQITDARIGARGETPRPAYYPDYVAWEQLLNHHDALTDTFVLGMVMGSLATGLDFTDPEELQQFVGGRANLTALNPRMSPVIAQLIERMTELDRSERPQDLSTVAQALAHYRYQELDDNLDAETPAGDSRRVVLLERLRNRLFEVSRRNRLLYFRETGSTANLTVGSVPHVMDVDSIRLQQLLFTNEDFCAALGRERALRLDRWLRFEDYPFLATSLDRIRLQANRDAKEFGFSQLRLVTAFLRWYNLKDAPNERINSPLILVPATLRKRKGVRDSFELLPNPQDAEINPALRHYLSELYDIRLPERIDAGSFDEIKTLSDSLAQQLARADKGIELELVHTPRIQLIKRKAMRRLDRYRRKLRKTGRGLKSYGGLSYSYSGQRHEPLGVQIFARDIRPANAPSREMVESETQPRVIEHMTSTATIERDFFTIDDGDDKGSSHWEVDLCSVSLANFSYRKMTLVRDYTELAANDDGEQVNFERLFSESTRPRFDAPVLPPVSERYTVLPTDPSQQDAVLRARSESSYVIQGPPGTGKSQTITNLIVDYIARGKSVLFVCEKRAALDVVFHRLRQVGVEDACCLIHDTREDKKPFIASLKERYEQAIYTAPRADLQQRRVEWLDDLNQQIETLETFSNLMMAPEESSHIPLRQVIGRWIESGATPTRLSAQVRSTLPQWESFADAAGVTASLRDTLARDGHEGVLARSPMRYLRADLAQKAGYLEFVEKIAGRSLEALADARDTQALVAEFLERDDLTLGQLKAATDHARELSALAEAERLTLLDVDDPAAVRLQKTFVALEALEKTDSDASAAAQSWHADTDVQDIDMLVDAATRKEGSFFAFLSGQWRRAKALVRTHYDGTSKSIAEALTLLQKRHAARGALEEAIGNVRAELKVEDVAGCRALLQEAWHSSADMPALKRDFVRIASSEPSAARSLLKLAREGRQIKRADDELANLFCEYDDETLDTLHGLLQTVVGDVGSCDDYVDDIAVLATLDEAAGRAIRRIDLPFKELEVAVLDETIRRRLRRKRGASRFDAQQLERTIARLGELARSGWQLNSAYALDVCAKRFHEHVVRANESMANTTQAEKDWRRAYNRGRKLLEREFEKTRAYRSVRELFAAESGPVLRDLRPVWLMSPLSVADALPLTENLFDVVIFDEASQIPLEDAIPTINRAQQMIVVGDDMQLPPTRFFSGKAAADEEEDPHLPDVIQFDLNADSFLRRASAALPGTMLAWHYRSKHESLIGFCNRAFYAGDLKTIPTPGSLQARPAITVDNVDTAQIHTEDLFERPISVHRLTESPYQAQRNTGEANYIARLVRAILADAHRPTIGIVAFSQAQQSEIESALTRLAADDIDFRNQLELEEDREEEDQFVGLFVKNLENVQGDERDIIILSVCYGPNENGRMLMNFGPINQNGGHKRLNVIFSRAKRQMVVVTSIDPQQITNTYNEGANALRQYLRYAGAVSRGDQDGMLAALNEYGHSEREIDTSSSAKALQAQIRAALEARGFEVVTDYGQSELRCQLAVRRPGHPAYELAVLIDDGTHYAIEDLQSRYVTNAQILTAFGWRVAFVLGKDWYQDRAQVIDGLSGLLDSENPDA